MNEDLLSQVILGAPNFVGFLISLMVLWRAFSELLSIHKSLIDSVVKRENCKEDE